MDTDKDIPTQGVLMGDGNPSSPVPEEGTEGEIIEGEDPIEEEPDTEDDKEEND